MTGIIYDTPEAAQRRLVELGVSLEALQRAVVAGYTARISTTDNDAPQMPGTYAWGMTVRVLRDELCSSSAWRKDDTGNFSLVINDTRKLNIVVETGDRFTKTHFNPKTKSSKGLFVAAIALRNRIDSDLFPETLEADMRRALSVIKNKTYVLLIYSNDDECRAELSLPDQVEENQITSWAERIFIPENFDPFDMTRPAPSDDEDIDIPVKRRA